MLLHPVRGPHSLSARARWVRRFVRLVLVIGTICLSDIARAQPVPRPNVELWTLEPNESGFTLGDLLDQTLWALVRHPLTPAGLSRIEQNVHRPPHRGVQFELLTPGDIGATVHFRW